MLKRALLAVAVLGAVGCGSSGGGPGVPFDIATQMVTDAYFYLPLEHQPTDFSELALIYDPATNAVLGTLPGGSLALRGFSGPLTGSTTFDVTSASYGDSTPATGTGEITNDGNDVDVSFTVTSAPADPPWTFSGTLEHIGPLGG